MTIIDVDALLHTIQDQAGVNVGPPAGVPNDAFYFHGTGVWCLNLGTLGIERVDVTESFLRLDGGEALASTHNAPAVRFGRRLSQHSELDGEHEMIFNPEISMKTEALSERLGWKIPQGEKYDVVFAKINEWLEELVDLRAALVSAAVGNEQYLYTQEAERLQPSRGLIVNKARPGGSYPMMAQHRVRVADWGRPKHGFSPGLNIVDDPCSFAEGAAWLKQQHTAAMAGLGASEEQRFTEEREREAREGATDAARYRDALNLLSEAVRIAHDPEIRARADARLDELAVLGEAIEAEIEASPPPDAKLVEALKKAEPLDAWSMIAKRYPKA